MVMRETGVEMRIGLSWLSIVSSVKLCDYDFETSVITARELYASCAQNLLLYASVF